MDGIEPMDAPQQPLTVDRREGPYGEVVLRRRGPADAGTYEIIANGCFLMDTSDGRSERLLVDAALDALPPQRADLRVLIGGLGVGFSLAHAAAQPRWSHIAVVEREPAILDWHRTGPLAAYSAGALEDPRVRVIEDDLVRYVRRQPPHSARSASGGPTRPESPGHDEHPTEHPAEHARHDVYAGTYDALCLDIDNGPDWTVTDDNGSLYSPGGLTACRERLAPGGVLAVWSAQPSQRFETALRNAGFAEVHTLEVPVARGVPDVVHIGVTA